MSWLSELMHPGRAYSDAAGEIQQATDQAQGYQQPYYGAGTNQLTFIQDMINKMGDPKAFMGDMLSDYEESPYAKAATDAATERANQAAAQMGLAGSSNQVQGIANQAGKIASKDRNEYLQNLLGIYGTAGQMSQNLAGMGQTAGSNMGNIGMQGARDVAGLNVAGRQAGANMLGKLLGTLGGAGINYATGGGFGLGSDMFGGG